MNPGKGTTTETVKKISDFQTHGERAEVLNR